MREDLHNDRGMTFEQIKDAFIKLKELGVLEMTITGEEIFYRTDTMEIIELARMMGFKINIRTNISLPNEEIFVKLAESNLNKENNNNLSKVQKTDYKMSTARYIMI